MALSISTDADEIAALLDPLIAADPVRHTVFVTIRDAVCAPDAAPWCAWLPTEPGALAARSQAHTPVAAARGWREVGGLADHVAELPGEVSVAGPVGVVDRLVAELAARGLRPERRVDERLFRLDRLTPPTAIAGSTRPAGPADLALVARWRAAFVGEAFGGTLDPDVARRTVQPDLDPAAPRRYWFWCSPDGTPGSVALRQQFAHGVARLGPVYTPPDLRGQGFGSAVTAAASREVLDAGAVPVLFTDLANPTSNKIYAALGYRPVEDHARVSFERPGSAGDGEARSPHSSGWSSGCSSGTV